MHPMRAESDRIKKLVLGAAFCAGVLLRFDPALAQIATGQEPVGAGAPSEPPLSPPVDHALPTGVDQLSLGPWLLSPSLDTYSFYDSNIYSAPNNRLSGPGFHIHPNLLADWDTGIHDTKLYGDIDSEIYPTLNYTNNTFNRQAGVIETYSPLRDLNFTTQFDYTHNSLAAAVTNSLPTPITTSANPPPVGAAGVIAVPQSVISPNDTYTATANVSKELNRAFVNFGGTFSRTEYENTPTQNYDQGSYYGSAGAWVTPLFYGFTDALDANYVPVVGSISNSYRARGGIGTRQIWLFQGSAYYGQQGTAVDGDGSAGGDIYGGVLSFFPTPIWNMSVQVDRTRNQSDISSATNLGLGGLSLSAIAVPTNASAQITTIAYRTNYALSDQTRLYAVVSDTRIAYLDMLQLDNSWLASAGISYQVRDNLSLSLDYQYTRYLASQPNTSFTRNLVSLGAHYHF